jgi:3,4-dihydroxy 2-butanone 4-phosphate synthase/GTP cyclohydrolase II
VRVYANKVAYAEHVALVRGDVSGDEPVLVRVHQHNLFADSLGDMTPGEFFGGEARPRDRDLQNSMRAIAKADRGVIVLIREPTATTVGRMVKEREGMRMSKPMDELRQFGIGAQMLVDIGVKNMILMSHATHRMIGIEGYGITVVDQIPIPEVEE